MIASPIRPWPPFLMPRLPTLRPNLDRTAISTLRPTCLRRLVIMPQPARPISHVFKIAQRFPSASVKLLGMIDHAVVGYEPVFDIKLVVFPEFAHVRTDLPHSGGNRRSSRRFYPERTYGSVCVEGEGAGGCISRPARFSKSTPNIPARFFNTTCLIGPDGILSRYRKVNPWLPWELHTSPPRLS